MLIGNWICWANMLFDNFSSFATVHFVTSDEKLNFLMLVASLYQKIALFITTHQRHFLSWSKTKRQPSKQISLSIDTRLRPGKHCRRRKRPRLFEKIELFDRIKNFWSISHTESCHCMPHTKSGHYMHSCNPRKAVIACTTSRMEKRSKWTTLDAGIN